MKEEDGGLVLLGGMGRVRYDDFLFFSCVFSGFGYGKWEMKASDITAGTGMGNGYGTGRHTE